MEALVEESNLVEPRGRQGVKPRPPQARLRITTSLLVVGVSLWIRAVVAVPFTVSVSPCRLRIGCSGSGDRIDTAVSIPRCGVGRHGESRSSRGSHGGRAKVEPKGKERSVTDRRCSESPPSGTPVSSRGHGRGEPRRAVERVRAVSVATKRTLHPMVPITTAVGGARCPASQ